MTIRGRLVMNRAIRMTSVLDPEAESVNCQKGSPIRSARISLTTIASSVGSRKWAPRLRLRAQRRRHGFIAVADRHAEIAEVEVEVVVAIHVGEARAAAAGDVDRRRPVQPDIHDIGTPRGRWRSPASAGRGNARSAARIPGPRRCAVQPVGGRSIIAVCGYKVLIGSPENLVGSDTRQGGDARHYLTNSGVLRHPAAPPGAAFSRSRER